MSNNTNSGSSGVGITGLLFIVFLVLKLTHVIDWSWWWITAPLWGVFALIIVALFFVFIFKVIMLWRKEKK